MHVNTTPFAFKFLLEQRQVVVEGVGVVEGVVDNLVDFPVLMRVQFCITHEIRSSDRHSDFIQWNAVGE